MAAGAVNFVSGVGSKPASSRLPGPLNGCFCRESGLSQLARRSLQPFGQPIPIGDVDREGLLQNFEQSLCHCRVLAGSLQHRDGLTLTVEVALPALNAHFGVLKKVFQVPTGHQAASPPMAAFLPVVPTSTQS